jgi:hypothetical protein
MTEEELKDAEDKVIHNGLSKSVTVCGVERVLAPLPVKAAKRLSSVLNEVVKGFNKIANTPSEERVATALGGQEEQITDAFVSALGILAEHYKWPITIKDIEEQMPLKEIRTAVLHQAALNEEDDFLLLPLRLVSQVLSQTTGALNRVATGQAVSMPDSESSGAADQPS